MKWRVLLAIILVLTMLLGCQTPTAVPNPPTAVPVPIASTTPTPTPTPTPAPTTNIPTISLTYENSAYGVGIKYPQGWTKQEGATETVVQFFAPKESSSTSQSAVAIVVKDMAAQSLSLDAYTERVTSQLQQTLTDFNLIESSSTTLAGNPAHKVVYTGKQEQRNPKVYQVWTIINNKAYMIKYAADPSKYADFIEIVQQMTNSFSVSTATATLTPTITPAPTTKPAPSPTVVGFYSGPLFDTHLHMGSIQKSWAAEGLPSYLQQRKVDWAIGFYRFSSNTSSELLSRNRIVNGLNSYVIPLLQAGANDLTIGWGQFVSGQYSEAVLRKFLQPQGPLQGVGEFCLYDPGLQSVTFDSPVMQTLFQVVNEVKGIVMIHPSNVERGGRPTELSEIEPSVRKYPDAIFLFHGKSVSNLVIQLMDKYPNVYFTMDVLNWVFTGKNVVNYNLLNPHGSAAETAERFLADVNRIGSDRLVEDSLTEMLPILQKYPDRIMWGTDLSASWHFEDSVTDTVIEITSKFIGKLPADIQEKYAYQNAQRVFGRFLTPNP